MTLTKVKIKLKKKSGNAGASGASGGSQLAGGDFITMEQLREVLKEYALASDLEKYLLKTGGKIDGELEVTGAIHTATGLSSDGYISLSEGK
ncbi:MAG: hypothetical protein K2N91_00475 [Muribaculaceae bacterium]|nr:hypothetical protein [Muribaculaceae bacterium]